MRGPLRALTHVPAIERAIDLATAGEGFDPWGFSRDQARVYYSLAYWLYRYFRPLIRGIEHVPSGRVLIVPNHSGQLPFDALVVAVACLTEANPPRLVRAMAERWVPTLPFVNIAFARAGVVLGDPTNCANLLRANQAILVFPEGASGSGKPWAQRYRLEPFGRGFMRLALQTETPIVPVAVVGAEEAIVSLTNVRPLARLLRLPYLPFPALLPLLGPLAFLPLPTRFHVTFGEAMRFTGPFDDEDEVIDTKVRVVMSRVQQLVDEGRARRRSVFA
jgi:1-acyl-sn-glycerol-3-phosphate acyltransferase